MAKSNSRNGSRHMMICKNDHGKKIFLPLGKYFSPTREENFSHGENSPVFRLSPYPKAFGHKKSPHLRCRAIYRCSSGVDYHDSFSAAKIRQKNWPCKKIGKNLRKSYVNWHACLYINMWHPMVRNVTLKKTQRHAEENATLRWRQRNVTLKATQRQTWRNATLDPRIHRAIYNNNRKRNYFTKKRKKNVYIGYLTYSPTPH